MKKILKNKLVQHFLFWCFYFLFYYLTFRAKGEPIKLSLVTAAVSLPYQLFFTYSQIAFLIPRFLLKRKHTLYLLLTLVCAKVASNIAILTYRSIVIPMETGNAVKMPWDWLYKVNLQQVLPLFSMLTICGIAVAIKLLKRYYLENDRNQKIEQEKTLMELEMLKAQVHPHFLFNTLNNLYSLTLTRSTDAPVVVTHLSGLLRYMLYDCNEKDVPLNNEIAALKKYMELEKLRYGSRLDVSFSCSGQTAALMIAPLLLLPFVENSFKHGVSQQLDQCWISLHLHADDGAFTFNLSNSCSKEPVPAAFGGIGLQNIQKRLDLIYADNYSMNITRQEELYSVKLILQLPSRIKLAAREEIPVSHTLPVAAV